MDEQQIEINLGDLARYLEVAWESAEKGHTLVYRAQQRMPEHSKPHFLALATSLTAAMSKSRRAALRDLASRMGGAA